MTLLISVTHLQRQSYRVIVPRYCPLCKRSFTPENATCTGHSKMMQVSAPAHLKPCHDKPCWSEDLRLFFLIWTALWRLPISIKRSVQATVTENYTTLVSWIVEHIEISEHLRKFAEQPIVEHLFCTISIATNKRTPSTFFSLRK